LAGIGFVTDHVAADTFRPAAALFLLTHFHSDHCEGLKADGPPIVCSTLTGRLIAALHCVDPTRLRTIDPGQSLALDQPAPMTITAFDANHCPGAVMFLIETEGQRIVLTGDFRVDDGVRRITPMLAGADVLYLDATYRGTGLRFPPQAEAVARVVEICRGASAGVALGVYTIGKNRVLHAAHEVLGAPFYVPRDRYRVYEILGDAPGCITDERRATPHSAYGVGYLERYFRPRDETVVVPTGWAAWRRRARPWIHYVPYSEHCDEAELDEFLDLTRPKRWIEVR